MMILWKTSKKFSKGYKEKVWKFKTLNERMTDDLFALCCFRDLDLTPI